MSPTRSWTEWCTILEGSELPGLVVDLDAIKANMRVLVGAVQSDAVALRLFTPEIPCPALIRELLVDGAPHFQGLACVSSSEAQLLVELGFDDILVLTPSVLPDEALQLAELSQSHRIVVLVDDPQHLEILHQAAQARQSTIRVCIDVNIAASPGDRLPVSRLTSSIRDSEQARVLAQAIEETEGLELEGVRVADPPPISGSASWTRRGRKKARQAILDRRLTVVQALRGDGQDLALVSAGRSRDLESCTSDPAVSEVNLGCGLLGGNHANEITDLPLQPAAFLALPVIRRPGKDHVICASPSHQDGPLRILSPLGVQSINDHALGPHQTLMSLEALTPALDMGAPVLCQPTHPGRMMDHFSTIILVQDGKSSTARTLRGL